VRTERSEYEASDPSPTATGILPAVDPIESLPKSWQSPVSRLMQEAEQPLAFIELDLDEHQRFGSRLLLLTNQRLCELPASDRPPVFSIGYQFGTKLSANIYGGLGTLELLAGDEVRRTWHYTAAVARNVDRFVLAYAAAHRSGPQSGQRTGLDGSWVCPDCGASIPAEQSVCPTCVPTAAPPPTRSLLRLSSFARRRMGTIGAGLALTVAATAVGLIPPYLTMPLLDRVLIPRQTGGELDQRLMMIYLGGLALAAVVAWLLSWAKTYTLALASEQVSADLRLETYRHLQRLSLDYFGGKRTGDLIARISSDTDRICNYLSVHLVDFTTDILLFVFTAIVLVTIDPALAAATLIPLPLLAWLVQRVRTRLRHGFARASHAWGEMVSVLNDSISGVRVVKAFAQESREVERFSQANQHVRDSNVRVNRLWSFFGPTVTLLTELGVLIIWGFGVWRVASGAITVGVLTAFIAYISRFYARLDSMSRMLANTQRAAAASYRIFEILDRKPSVMEPARPRDPGRLDGRIVLRDVYFKYDTRPVIRGVSLEIHPGEMIGIVGPSGAGKSTLVNLICRFYDPTSGSIEVDGQDIRNFSTEAYRRNIGIVLQEAFLFYGTIAENIAYGRPDADRHEIVQAARAAHAHDFIARLPDGYDSLVGERGQGLSGGERQRISIARALLTDPRILILDEATSAVDNQTEREIQRALEHLVQGRTTIAIAHRLSTLRAADRIIVFEQGQIVDIGRHEELLERGGLYGRLYQSQIEMSEQMAV